MRNERTGSNGIYTHVSWAALVVILAIGWLTFYVCAIAHTPEEETEIADDEDYREADTDVADTEELLPEVEETE